MISSLSFCKTGVITYNRDRSTPAQFDCISESSDLEPQSPPEPYSMHLEMDGQAPDNQLMSSLMPGPQPQAVQLMPPGVCECVQTFALCVISS